jgi:hypothetical protein
MMVTVEVMPGEGHIALELEHRAHRIRKIVVKAYAGQGPATNAGTAPQSANAAKL